MARVAVDAHLKETKTGRPSPYKNPAITKYKGHDNVSNYKALWDRYNKLTAKEKGLFFDKV